MSFKEHKYCKPPNDPQKPIWRYMSFIKFFSILETGSLFFPKLSVLPDKYEGYVSSKTMQYLKNSIKKSKELNSEQQKQHYERLLDMLKDARDFLFVCSWHLNFSESAGMWGVYLNNREGLAIKSSYKSMVNCFRKTVETVYIGVVDYMNIDLDKISMNNVLIPALCKRSIFKYEQELRAIIISYEKRKTNGIYVKVDLNTLIEGIYLSPNTEEWIQKIIENALKRFGINSLILKSEVNMEPPY